MLGTSPFHPHLSLSLFLALSMSVADVRIAYGLTGSHRLHMCMGEIRRENRVGENMVKTAYHAATQGHDKFTFYRELFNTQNRIPPKTEAYHITLTDRYRFWWTWPGPHPPYSCQGAICVGDSCQADYDTFNKTCQDHVQCTFEGTCSYVSHKSL